MKKIILRGFSISLILALAITIVFLSTSNDRTSKRFAQHLFNYPLPPETEVIAMYQSNGKNFVDGGGSGGYWNVVAVMELSSKLSKNEILAYYRDVDLFGGGRRGVELELYFQGQYKKVENRYGFYIRSLDNRERTVSQYTNVKSDTQNQVDDETNFAIQIIGGFDYFLNID